MRSFVPASAAILAQLIESDTSLLGSRLAGHGLDVTHPARPAALAVAVVAGAVLRADAVLAGRLLAPVDDVFAPSAGPARRALAEEAAVAVEALAVDARSLVADRHLGLAVGPCEPLRSKEDVIIFNVITKFDSNFARLTFCGRHQVFFLTLSLPCLQAW